MSREAQLGKNALPGPWDCFGILDSWPCIFTDSHLGTEFCTPRGSLNSPFLTHKGFHNLVVYVLRGPHDRSGKHQMQPCNQICSNLAEAGWPHLSHGSWNTQCHPNTLCPAFLPPAARIPLGTPGLLHICLVMAQGRLAAPHPPPTPLPCLDPKPHGWVLL